MNRRRVISMFGGAAVALPFAARAQQPMPVIGYLGSASPELWAGRVNAFRQGLRETGYVDGQNVRVELRWAESHYDRLPALAAELVRLGVAVIVAPGSAPAALVAKAATTTTPIVFETGADPVAAGLVPSLSRPGGNITGVTALAFELGPKRLELLLQFVPSAKSIAVLYNPTAGDIVQRQTRDLKAAASKLGVDLQILGASTDGDLDEVFAAMRQRGAGALVIVPDVFTNSRDAKLGALALRYAMPAIFQAPAFAAAGGFLSYGGDIAESHRLAGNYAGRVLKGEKPADLPVMQAAKVTMTVNLKTAKALGIDIPLPLLGRADEVIE